MAPHDIFEKDSSGEHEERRSGEFGGDSERKLSEVNTRAVSGG